MGKKIKNHKNHKTMLEQAPQFKEDNDELAFWEDMAFSKKDCDAIREQDAQRFSRIGGAIIYIAAQNQSFMAWVNKQNKQYDTLAPELLNLKTAGAVHEEFFRRTEPSIMMNISRILRAIPLVTRKQFYDRVEKSLGSCIAKARKYNNMMEYMDNESKGPLFPSPHYVKLYVYYHIAHRDSYGRLLCMDRDNVKNSKEANFVCGVISLLKVEFHGFPRAKIERLSSRLKLIADYITLQLKKGGIFRVATEFDMGEEMASFIFNLSQENILSTDVFRSKLSDDELQVIVYASVYAAAESYFEDKEDSPERKYRTAEEICKKVDEEYLRLEPKEAEIAAKKHEAELGEKRVRISNTPISVLDNKKYKQNLDEIMQGKTTLTTEFDFLSEKTYHVPDLEDFALEEGDENEEKSKPSEGEDFLIKLLKKGATSTVRSLLTIKLARLSNNGKAELINVLRDNAARYEKAGKAEEQRENAYKVEEARKATDKKQKTLNELQLKYDRLEKKLAEAEEKNRILMWASEDNDEEDNRYDDVEPEGEPEIGRQDYPKNTVLIGGHARWQKFFKQHHPGVKMYDGNNASFNANAITSKTPLVLINVTHMCHPAYWKLRNRLKETGTKWEYIYPRYRGAVATNTVNK